jgi:hypothetical protein
MADPLVGSLPQSKDERSPALTGQPASVTGQPGVGVGGQMPSTQGSAMAPASPPVGTAEVGGAPLSSDGANERQGGAGATSDLDLVKDRGTPREYWNKNIKTLGSKEALSLLSDAAYGSSGKTGQFAEMDPEEVRRAGTRMNEAMGLATRQQQDQAIEEMVFTPMQDNIKYEVSKGVLDVDEGVMRMAMTMAQVQGAEDEDELAAILADARARIGGKS